MDMNEKIVNLIKVKTCKVSADNDSKATPKTIHLRVKFDGATVGDVFEKAMATTVIQWQTKARKTFASLTDNGTVDITFQAPARTTVDPIAETKARFATMTPAEKKAFLDELAALQAK